VADPETLFAGMVGPVDGVEDPDAAVVTGVSRNVTENGRRRV
jgi:hypothetical protein